MGADLPLVFLSLHSPSLALSLLTPLKMIKKQTENSKYDPQHIKDLLKVLPVELFSRSCSFLPPASIASSSAICKAWRASILSNPIWDGAIELPTIPSPLPTLLSILINSKDSLELILLIEIGSI